MDRTIELGIPGVHLNPGDHVCGFYRGLDGFSDLVAPFMAAGLASGDTCVGIVDQTTPREMTERLGFPSSERPDNMVLWHSLESYFGTGSFSAQQMIDRWLALLDQVAGGANPFVRIACEMSWALRDLPGVEELLAYEAQYNYYSDRYKQVALCLYDLDRFGASVLIDILKTHPRVLTGGIVHDNPYYIPPDEFLSTARRRDPVPTQ